jgi:branched-chain amino acid transport system ATP-binding protein
VRETADQTGCGVLLVEQHVDLALEVADRAYVMTHGSISIAMEAEELRGEKDILRAAYMGETAFEAASGELHN